jgi:prefoldin subunit 5
MSETERIKQLEERVAYLEQLTERLTSLVQAIDDHATELDKSVDQLQQQQQPTALPPQPGLS